MNKTIEKKSTSTEVKLFSISWRSMNLLSLFFVFCCSSYAVAKDFPNASIPYGAKVLRDNLSNPWAVVSAPNGRLYITDTSGKIEIFNNKGRKLGKLNGLPKAIEEVGQGGLMDMIFHPDYKRNFFVYLTYSTNKNANPSNGYNTRVSRFLLQGNQLMQEKVLFQGAFGTDGAHFGSRMAFDQKGYLYVTFGDRHHKEKAQKLEFLNGKVVRIFADGKIPEDNPFFTKAIARKEIFTYGHRNPQGIDVHPEYGFILISEHGPSGYDARLPEVGRIGKADEVNLLEAGANYGWPLIFGDPKILPWTKEMHAYVNQQGMKLAFREYTNPDGIAPSGASFYRGEKFPAWKNDFFIAALRGYLIRMKVSKEKKIVEEEKILPDGFSRIRDVTTGKDGLLYVVTGMGQLIQIKPL